MLAFEALREGDEKEDECKGPERCPDADGKRECYICPRNEMAHAIKTTHPGAAFLAGAELVRLMAAGFTVAASEQPADAVYAATVIHGEQKAQEAEAMQSQ